MSGLSSDRTGLYEYFTCEEILPSDLSRKLGLIILHLEKYLKIKQKQLKIKKKNKLKL